MDHFGVLAREEGGRISTADECAINNRDVARLAEADSVGITPLPPDIFEREALHVDIVIGWLSNFSLMRREKRAAGRTGGACHSWSTKSVAPMPVMVVPDRRLTGAVNRYRPGNNRSSPPTGVARAASFNADVASERPSATAPNLSASTTFGRKARSAAGAAKRCLRLIKCVLASVIHLHEDEAAA
jgi:hypothetical protein